MAFQKGVSGNPKGRRKERMFFNALMIEFNSCPDDKRTIRAIAEKLIAMALEGNIHAIKEIANRLDGLPVASVDVGIDRNMDVRELTDEQLERLIAGLMQEQHRH
jgi:hypothetical protein